MNLSLKLLLCLNLILPLMGVSQNLVRNGSFEDYSALPTELNEWEKCVGWTNASSFIATPDYCHVDGTGSAALPDNFSATVWPHTGNAIMGFITESRINPETYREYLQTRLTEPLEIGQTYTVTFWLTNGVGPYSTGMASNNIGLRFSKAPIKQTLANHINVIPQLEITDIIWHTDWQEFSFCFTADSAYDYLTIGNFRNKDNTLYTELQPPYQYAYYFIDDIQVIPPIYIRGDSTICRGDSTLLVAFNDVTFAWAESQAPQQILSNSSSLWVSPTSTTTYLAYGSKDTASFTVEVHEFPELNLGPDAVICPGTSLTLDATTPDASYSWQDQSTNATLRITEPDTYWVTIEVNGCEVTDSITITQQQTPTISLGEDTTLCEGIRLLLDVFDSSYSYLWQNGSTEADYTVSRAGTYWIQVSNLCGISYDTIVIAYEPCDIIIEIPTAFTPNQDGLNDVFLPANAENYSKALFSIYSRWGEKLFETTNLKHGWNGTFNDKACSEGVYIWILKAADVIGKPYSASGTFTLLR